MQARSIICVRSSKEQTAGHMMNKAVCETGKH